MLASGTKTVFRIETAVHTLVGLRWWVLQGGTAQQLVASAAHKPLSRPCGSPHSGSCGYKGTQRSHQVAEPTRWHADLGVLAQHRC